MEHNNDDLLSLGPVAQYTPPAFPTLADKPQLKKLPFRWQKNAAVITCIGLAGTLAFSACANIRGPHHGGSGGAPIYVTTTTEQETIPFVAKLASEMDFELRMHYGGSGGGPVYVVHLTEQEALGIIRAKLEAAGLRFDATPPDYVLNDGEDGWGPTIALDLYDAQRNAAVAFLGWEASQTPFWHRSTQDVAEQFAELTDMPIGVIFNPGETVGDTDWMAGREGREITPPSDEEVTFALPILLARLEAQVQDFIYSLQDESLAKPAIDLEFTIHRETWSTGATSRYNVQLTEQQALDIVRTELEAAGLNFSDTPPKHTVERPDRQGSAEPLQTVSLALFDAQSNVAVALFSDGYVWQHEAQLVAARFAEVTDIPVGVFYNPRMTISDGTLSDRDNVPEPSQAQAANSAPVLYARLVAQAQMFIATLQAEGII